MANTNAPNAPSNPIPIVNPRGRSRSVSISSASSGSTSSASDLPTPPSSSMGSQRISIPSPSTSPILSYFLAQSPSKSTPTPAGTFPFRRSFGPSPVFEEDEAENKEIPVAAHARRASVAASNRFSGQATAQPAHIPEALQDRGTGLLRRLSLSSSAFTKPQIDSASRGPPSPPPNSAVNPTQPHSPPLIQKPRRSATISDGAGRPRRAPSPMGERILKGHFDGFN
ncbi:hypothetical protein CC1G_07096 [Coprinopsis cinerea okayama7|uniref:Uncharacterized protein n=1 Tax=Coprinopsis cinerea (strain Okayama-7 / 130 / ATCC MYA-4618 / FGSC 9003) TaxID=240176 RepID=A8NUG2_COPC7|nr:hypothetical protein CC1G_07096 [Coprinopsis cinerea okayama7\|eukprot:XP_001836449.2 hypothetical protein CC1G_07096 [Coprinopsis cinerea okayama7\